MKKLESLFLRVFRKDEVEVANLTDEQVLAQYRLRQDPDLVGILFTRYTHLVYGNCLHYLEDPELAQDAVMQIFEGLFESLKQTEVRHFSSWLYQVSRNHCLMEIRKKKTRQRAKVQLTIENTSGFVESPEDVHLYQEEGDLGNRRMAKALGKLNGDQRKCLELMYLEGKSYKEIVEITGLDWNQVKSHIQNGKRNLRKSLEASLLLLILFIINLLR